MKVAVLEAGAPVTPDPFGDHVPPYKLNYRDTRPNGVASSEITRRRPIQARQGACLVVNYGSFLDDVDNRYTTPEEKTCRKSASAPSSAASIASPPPLAARPATTAPRAAEAASPTAIFWSPFTALAAAERTGNLTLIADAPASHVAVERLS